MGKLTSARNSQGFTLIELLIVVVIIGILAAIAIPQFATARERAFDSAAKSDMRNMMSLQEAYFADHQVYIDVETTSGTETAAIELGTESGIFFTPSDQILIGVEAFGGEGVVAHYRIQAEHSQSSRQWCVDTNPQAANSGKIVNCTDAGGG